MGYPTSYDDNKEHKRQNVYSNGDRGNGSGYQRPSRGGKSYTQDNYRSTDSYQPSHEHNDHRPYNRYRNDNQYEDKHVVNEETHQNQGRYNRRDDYQGRPPRGATRSRYDSGPTAPNTRKPQPQQQDEVVDDNTRGQSHGYRDSGGYRRDRNQREYNGRSSGERNKYKDSSSRKGKWVINDGTKNKNKSEETNKPPPREDNTRTTTNRNNYYDDHKRPPNYSQQSHPKQIEEDYEEDEGSASDDSDDDRKPRDALDSDQSSDSDVVLPQRRGRVNEKDDTQYLDKPQNQRDVQRRERGKPSRYSLWQTENQQHQQNQHQHQQSYHSNNSRYSRRGRNYQHNGPSTHAHPPTSSKVKRSTYDEVGDENDEEYDSDDNLFPQEEFPPLH
eukprot:NODE_1600_length_1890_cov_14.236559_g1352_i0.p1 GENE.NODE_1600_length_1890_cov_14.236559_g1352_i0~~NODE_1600_length_1890_cov_14.236559_g1352_i0.p1  ORF type:complete len:387 (-),score=107.56 NODE_1600_length_1890_cov_14.236559_g1352_i0:595-1755(-)